MKQIDADMLVSALEADSENDQDRWSFGELKLMIGRIPTVEAEPVRHAHWVIYDPTDANSNVYCSDCHASAIDIGESGICMYLETSWCHNCGAKMDEERGY